MENLINRNNSCWFKAKYIYFCDIFENIYPQADCLRFLVFAIPVPYFGIFFSKCKWADFSVIFPNFQLVRMRTIRLMGFSRIVQKRRGRTIQLSLLDLLVGIIFQHFLIKTPLILSNSWYSWPFWAGKPWFEIAVALKKYLYLPKSIEKLIWAC